MPDSRSLETIQRWLQTVITHPDGVSFGITSSAASTLIKVEPHDVETIICRSKEMSGIDRLQIYGRAYFGRLLECLKAQYPALHHSIGEPAFGGLAFGYLVEHPSTSYSLASLGRSFEAYLIATRPARDPERESDAPDFADFLIDLARLERVYNDVFDGHGPEQVRSLKPEDFAGLTPAEFADCRLTLHECVRLIEFQFPVHEYASSIRRGLEPDPPIARPIHLVVTRRDYIVRRFELSKPQFQLLSALNQNGTVGEAIEAMCADTTFDVSGLRTDLQTWFRDWSAAPLFADIIKGLQTPD